MLVILRYDCRDKGDRMLHMVEVLSQQVLIDILLSHLL